MKNNRSLFILLTGLLLLGPVLLVAGTTDTTSQADFKKGLNLFYKNQFEAALVRFQLAIDEDWNFWQSYQMVGYCYYELRDKENALKAFEESLRLNPDNPSLARVIQALKSGALDVPIQPVFYEVKPIGPPYYTWTYSSHNK